MSRREYSLKRFTGSDGKRRINCAEAIAGAFHRDIRPLDDEVLKKFRKYGNGRAPGKACGAYYAAEYMLSGENPELLESLRDHFTSETMSVECKAIRRGKKLSCEGCVNNIAEFLSRNFPPAEELQNTGDTYAYLPG